MAVSRNFPGEVVAGTKGFESWENSCPVLHVRKREVKLQFFLSHTQILELSQGKALVRWTCKLNQLCWSESVLFT